MDIYQFIGIVNSRMNRASIAKAESTIVLFKYIPANLNLYLLHDSKDLTISYKDFASIVADVAEAKQHAYD
jgi:hypothetical protein